MAENKQAEKTSFVKGEEFEKLFAEFMKTDLKWDKYVIRSQQKGKRNSKGAQIDIIGERHDSTGNRYVIGSLVYLAAMVLFVIAALDSSIIWLAILGLAVGGVAVIFAYLSRNRHRENAWVECKCKEGPATRTEMMKSIEEFNDYKASGDTKYRYVVHYFVSASGFVVNALECAHDNGIICYTFKDGKFEKVQFWK